MIHLAVPYAVAALLVGLGIAGVLMRRNAVLVLVAVELILSGALVLFVTSGVAGPSRASGASVLPLFVMTIAAAEVVVALAVILAVFRARGQIDLDAAMADEPEPEAGSLGPEPAPGAAP